MKVYNEEGKEVENIQLNKDISAVKIKKNILYEVVRMQLANKRRGTASTKTRGEVSGGGIKPWRQKGTGRARVGSSRTPLWKGGGVVFGPHPRDYSYSLPKKVKRQAVKAALSAKVKEIMILDKLTLKKPKTKGMMKILNNLIKDNHKKALIVIEKCDHNITKSARNIPQVKVLLFQNLNVYDLLKYEKLIITKGALNKINEKFL